MLLKTPYVPSKRVTYLNTATLTCCSLWYKLAQPSSKMSSCLFRFWELPVNQQQNQDQKNSRDCFGDLVQSRCGTRDSTVEGHFSLSRGFPSLIFMTQKYLYKWFYDDRSFSGLFWASVTTEAELVEPQYELQRQDRSTNGTNDFPYMLQSWWFSPAENGEGSDRTCAGGRTRLMETRFISFSGFLFGKLGW